MKKVTNIKWDTDGDQSVLDFLPQEIILTERFSKENYTDKNGNFGEAERNAMLDDVSDWLSDEYEFCHDGFEIEEV